MITGALIAALVIVALFLHTQHSNRFKQIESHGLSLVQLLSRAPYSQLVPQGPEQSLLQFLKTSQSDASFAYIVVTDINNNVVADVSTEGVNPPVHRIGKQPSFWFGTRDVSSSSDSSKFREYYAPVIVGEALTGHLRIGYSIPRFIPLIKNLSLYSMLVLPVFLLAFAFHLLLRRQLQPLAGIHNEIQSLYTTPSTANLDKSGLVETGQFISTINTSIKNIARRTDELESQNREALTSSKVISFQRARLQSILHSLPYGIVVVDESGSISFANSQCGTYIGVTSEDIVGKKPNQVCTRPEVLDFFNRYSGQDVSKVGSMKFSLSDTAETYVNATAYPLFSGINSGQVSGNLVIFRDITEEQMARESRNEFIAQVGHELKTPMQIMGMYSEMLIEDTQASRELQLEVANVFNDQIDRINTLVSNLLNVSKIEMGAISLDRQKVKLTALLDGIYHYFEKSAEESGIGLAIECNVATCRLSQHSSWSEGRLLTRHWLQSRWSSCRPCA